MKLKEDAPATIAYKLDAGDDRKVLTEAPAIVVSEIAHRAKSFAYDESDEEFGLVLDGRMWVSKELFEAEPGDELRFPQAEKPKRRTRAASKA